MSITSPLYCTIRDLQLIYWSVNNALRSRLHAKGPEKKEEEEEMTLTELHNPLKIILVPSYSFVGFN